LDRDGHIKQAFGGLGDHAGSFSRPRGIAIDRENRLYAVDAAFGNVQIFSKDSRLLFFFGKPANKRSGLFLPAKVALDYDNTSYFQQYADPRFEIEAILIVTSQFGNQMVNVFALGREKGRKYLTEEEVMKQIEEKKQKFMQEHPEEAGATDTSKEEKK